MTCHRLHLLLFASLLAPAAGLTAEPAAEPVADQQPAAAGAAAAAAERDSAYRSFRHDFDARRFAEALPHAERVVSLTEQLDAHHPDLARALNNLGATQYELHDYLAAEKAYGRALALIEETHGSLSARLVAPLRGLALTYAGTGHAELAVPLLERAVAISRRAHGLFNTAQSELLTPLIDSYVAVGRYREADKVQLYALQIGEHAFGAADPRLGPALRQLGNWYLQTAQRREAREVWERLQALCASAAQPDRLCQVVALRGIAESYRLDFQFGVEPLPAPRPGAPPLVRDSLDLDPSRRPQSPFGPEFVLDSAGESALQHALAVVEQLQPPAPLARAVVLVDLGDWQLLAGRMDRALAFYQQALPLMPADGGGAESAASALSRPGLLLYRQPAAAERHRDQAAALFVEKYAVAQFTVTADGHVKEARVVEGDATEAQRSGLLYAIGRAIYRPRFVDGKPVATENVRFRESFRVPKS
jgi:tetratricopeptide (TPR) repeat protein